MDRGIRVDLVILHRFGFTNKDRNTSLDEAFTTTAIRVGDILALEIKALQMPNNSRSPMGLHDHMARKRNAKQEEMHRRFEHFANHALANPHVLTPNSGPRPRAALRCLVHSQSRESLVRLLKALMPGIKFKREVDQQQIVPPKPNAIPCSTRIFELDELADSVQTMDTPPSPPRSREPTPSPEPWAWRKPATPQEDPTRPIAKKRDRTMDAAKGLKNGGDNEYFNSGWGFEQLFR